jgi:Polyglycine hydrolase-like, structural repeat
MAFVTTGLSNGGVTAHYRFSYDDALAAPGGPEPARTNAVIASCELDYDLMSSWFGGELTVTGMAVQVTTQTNGASWSGTSTSSTIQLKAQGATYSNNAAYLRYLLIAEVTEIFMMTQGTGWFQGSDEGSKGEGLSRFLSGQFLARNGLLGIGIDADYAVADLWLNSPRSDFVNTAPDDNGYNATNGCTTLFIYYLFHQLGYTIEQIVGAAGVTLAAVYRNLTGDPNDPFPLFKRLLDTRFPAHTGSAVPGPNFDDPWPLGNVAWSGVWRSGNRPYYLWIHATQAEFLTKWQTLAAQNMRLTDLDIATVNGNRLWSGIWEDGTDGYYIWYDADQSHFLAKFTELGAQNLRLVSITTENGRYAGAWRSGSDGYYIWVDADDAHFLAKASELAAQNLRLVDVAVTTTNGQRRWCGVWRSGTDGWYIWINADWQHFLAKWNELAAQGLRLTGIRHYGGLWAGIWRSGNDGYYLWADANESGFLAKWGALAQQNLRLIDVIATPFGGATGAAEAEAEAEAAAEAEAVDALSEPVTVVTGGGSTGSGGGGGPSIPGGDGAPEEAGDTGGVGVGAGSALAAAAITGSGGGSLAPTAPPVVGADAGADQGSVGIGVGTASADDVRQRPVTAGSGAGSGVLPAQPALTVTAGGLGAGGGVAESTGDPAFFAAVHESPKADAGAASGGGVLLRRPSED